MTDWINYHCKFCNKKLENASILPPSCDCDEFVRVKEEWLEDYRNQPDYEKPLTSDEYNKKCPQTYFGERLVADKDGCHKLKLEARKYGDGEGLSVWHPFPYKKEDEEEEEEGGGLCWDFTSDDAAALHDMLGEYLEKKFNG